MFKIKRLLSTAMVAITLATSIDIASPVTAQAATKVKVKTEAELMKNLQSVVLKRGSSATYDLSAMSNSEFNKIFYLPNNDDWSGYEIFYTSLAEYDDPSTSSDGDYVVNIIDITNDNLYDFDGNTLELNITYLETASQTAKVDEYIEKAYKDLKLDGLGNYEKVKKIHDYVLKLITYDESKDLVNDTPYETFTNSKGYGTCVSYSLITYKLLTRAGIPCKSIGGNAGDKKDNGPHAWNLVELGDKWYYMDNTWDDDNDDTYAYFLRGSSDFDASDKSYFHECDPFYETSYFKNTYPMAKTAFNPSKDSDKNTLNVGSTFPGASRKLTNTTPSTPKDDTTPTSGTSKEPTSNSTDSKYTNSKFTIDDVVYGQDPKKLVTIKRGVADEFYLDLMDKDSYNYIKSVSVKKVYGNKKFDVTNMNLDHDEYGYFLYGEIKGKKKGKVGFDVVVTLKNGKSKTFEFDYKIK